MTLGTDDKSDGIVHHQHGKGNEVIALEGLREALVVAGQAAEACHPAEIALHDESGGAAGRSRACVLAG